jgi:hypothetical protein
VTSTQCATQRRTITTPTAIPVTSSRNTSAHYGTIRTDLTCRVVSSLASWFASTPTPLSDLEIWPTLIATPKACATITYPLRTLATDWNHRQMQWQLPTQAVSTPPSVVSSSRNIH